MSTASLQTIIGLLQELLRPELYEKADISWNGLQVEAVSSFSNRTSSGSSAKTVSKIGVAVDAGLSVLEAAVKEGCDLLITHHGLFWGSCPPVLTGLMAKKVSTLLQNGCSLYVSHLPLDGNERVGNAFELGRHLELQGLTGAFDCGGATIGAKGVLPEALPFSQCVDRFSSLIIPEGKHSITCELPFGPERISTIGIATGSASSLMSDAKALGCDLLLSGEPKHESYHTAKELELHAYFAGHYYTETFGVKAVARYLEDELQIATVFIDEPTGI